MSEHKVELRVEGELVGWTVLRRVNRNLAYLCKMYICPENRGNGHYPVLRAAAMDKARQLGYKGWIFTVRPDNDAHYQRIVQRHGKPINPIRPPFVSGLWWEEL